jgi:alkylated DNA repair protein (DNA oxidative demethylase)
MSAMQGAFFNSREAKARSSERAPSILAPGAWLLPRFAAAADRALVDALESIRAASPLRQLHTPGGHLMSVAMTNCGDRGWVSDRRGYRYERLDPLRGVAWPAMPPLFEELACAAATAAGYAGFVPDACLINRYEPGARMSLHQDRDERDLAKPIVSVSLGLPATFLLGGKRRSDRPQRVPLEHGDVLVWGGASRLVFHGVLPVKAGHHELLGGARLNLTFRYAA